MVDNPEADEPKEKSPRSEREIDNLVDDPEEEKAQETPVEEVPQENPSTEDPPKEEVQPPAMNAFAFL